jgi:cytochrome c oxidase cbb3-type subunit 4
MDINDIRSIITAVLLFAFIGLWIWAWGKGRKSEFDKSAALPLEEDSFMSDNERESN